MKRCRELLPLWIAIVLSVLAGIVVWVYLLKPYPGVESSNDWTLIDPPPNAGYRIGDVITWEKPRVCVPVGATTVQLLVRTLTPTGTFDAVAYTRVITNVDEGYCREPNRTAVVVPDFLPNGDYQMILRACTDTPNPRDTCIEVEGPRFAVVGSKF
jgi:hypothetical protein